MTGFLICDGKECKGNSDTWHDERTPINLAHRAQFHLKASDSGPQFPELEVRYIREKAAFHGWTVMMIDGKPTDYCPDCSGATVSTKFKTPRT